MKTIASLLLAMLCLSVLADDHKYFPGAVPDRRTQRASEQVEELYEDGDHSRAFLIYRNDLAPIGDKYAQYMVGYMYLNGQGTDADRAAALAWYRLAAERRDTPILQARDALYHKMSQEEVVRSNQIFTELWRKLGDNHLLLALIRKDLEILRSRTGSRILSATSSPTTIVSIQPGESGSDAYYDRVEKRMQMRLDYLDTNVEIVDLELGDELAVKEPLEQEVRAERATLDIS